MRSVVIQILRIANRLQLTLFVALQSDSDGNASARFELNSIGAGARFAEMRKWLKNIIHHLIICLVLIENIRKLRITI